MITKPKEAPFLSNFDDTMSDEEVNDLLEEITGLLQDVNPKGYFYCEVENFGWRKVGGHAFLELRSAQDFISKVLPKTECSFNIFKEKRILKVQNYHHDSPTGDEWYILVPITRRQFENNTKPKMPE